MNLPIKSIEHRIDARGQDLPQLLAMSPGIIIDVEKLQKLLNHPIAPQRCRPMRVACTLIRKAFEAVPSVFGSPPEMQTPGPALRWPKKFGNDPADLAATVICGPK
jgi:hypothetical protein